MNKKESFKNNEAVSIIIPIWNQLKLTRACLESIKKNTKQPYRLILVDNASDTKTQEYLKKQKDAFLIRNKDNLGWVKAINQGIGASKGKYVVFLNNDTEVPKNWLADLITAFKVDPEIGAVGPRSSSEKQWQGRVSVSDNLRSVGKMLSFFCVVLKSQAVKEVGLLDEKFGVGFYDDEDYSMRLKQAGYRLALAPWVTVKHHHRASFKAMGAKKAEKLLKKNFNYFRKKWKLKLKKTIYLAIPNEGTFHTELTRALPVIIQHGIDLGFQIKVKFYKLKPIAHSRNTIVKNFLAEEFDYLAMFDSDNVPPSNIFDLAVLDKDVIGGVYPQWTGTNLFWVVMDKVKGGYQQIPSGRRGGLKEVDAIGTGCILIKREVLKEVKAPFMRKWTEDGLVEIGQDFYFCEKAKRLGFKVWVHWGYPVSHYKTVDLLEIYKLIAKEKYGKK